MIYNIPLGFPAGAFLPDTGLQSMILNIRIAPGQPTPPRLGHPQTTILDRYVGRNGETALPPMSGLETGMPALAAQKGPVGIREVLKDVLDFLVPVMLEPVVAGIPAQGRELLA